MAIVLVAVSIALLTLRNNKAFYLYLSAISIMSGFLFITYLSNLFFGL